MTWLDTWNVNLIQGAYKNVIKNEFHFEWAFDWWVIGVRRFKSFQGDPKKSHVTWLRCGDVLIALRTESIVANFNLLMNVTLLKPIQAVNVTVCARVYEYSCLLTSKMGKCEILHDKSFKKTHHCDKDHKTFLLCLFNEWMMCAMVFR